MQDKKEKSAAAGEVVISRRDFAGAAVGAGMAAWALTSGTGQAMASEADNGMNRMHDGKGLAEEMTKAKIRRALLSGPESVTKDATVAEMDAHGKMSVLRQGSNHWVCVAGNENIIGAADMCADPMGLQWMMDAMAGKPKPTNSSPGLIYMLNGALQRSFTDPFDRTSPAIPIGPHWMVLWPFDSKVAGLPTVMRDAGTLIMFAGTPYAHLHICGSPWDGNEYHPGDRAAWTMTYVRPPSRGG